MASEYKPNFGVVTVTSSTTLRADAHGGKMVVGNAAAGLTISLPAATGSGVEFEIVVGTTITSNAFIIAADGTDIIQGVLGVATDAGGVNIPTGATTDYITMNGSTTGGVKGSRVVVKDAADGMWIVSGALISTGAEATPFAAT